ncbi:MAG: hypothetical protein WCS73_08760 [Lentisphaeria bacterium]
MSSRIATYTDFSRQGIINSRMRIIHKLLLHGVLTRKALCDRLNVSMATMTNHAQDLITNKILLSRTIPGIHSNRPIQELSLNSDFGICSTIKLQPHEISAELVNLDSTLIKTIKIPVKAPTQEELFAALEESAEKLEAFATARGEKIIHGVLGFHGIASPANQAIFSMDGISDWEPCSPFHFLQYFAANPIYDLSTWIMAKCKGFSHERQCDHHIGIVEFCNSTFHIAVIDNEQIILGHLGTSSPYLHCEVKNGLACYCGKKNCFNAYIKNGGFDPKIIQEGLHRIFKKTNLSIIGLEFIEHLETAKNLCHNNSSVNLILVRNGDELYQDGLRILAAENAWKRILNTLYMQTKK